MNKNDKFVITSQPMQAEVKLDNKSMYETEKRFTEAGFDWGGDWTTRKDYQHFEVIEDF